MSDTFTPNFKLTRTEFNTRGWQDKVNNNFSTLDAVTGSFLPLSGLKGVWTNFLAIIAGDILVDQEFGTLWKALVPHTTPATGTFLEDRLANPSRWTAYTQPAKSRGIWTQNTNYNTNDFVVVQGVSDRYAIALTSHLSSTNFDTDLAAGKWEVLIDVSLTGLGLGTMAVQNANNVNITGGVLGSAINVDGLTLFSPSDLSNDFVLRRPGAGGAMARATMASVQSVWFPAWIAYPVTPTIASTTGTITAYTANGQYLKINRSVRFRLQYQISNNGTGATRITITNALPVLPARGVSFCGSEGVSVGYGVGVWTSSHGVTTTMDATKLSDDGYPGGTNHSIVITGEYESQA